MPRVEGYRSRIEPRAGAALPTTNADAFGAGVGRAIGGAVETIERIETNRQWSEFQVEFSALREEMATASREARKTYNPDHVKALGDAYAKRQSELLDRIGSRRVRERAQAATADWGAGFRDSEADWQVLRASEIAVENHRQSLNASANRARRLDNAEDYTTETLIQLGAVDGIDASDKVKEALRTETEQTMAVAFLQGRIDADPVLAKAMLDSGAFDEVLTPAQVEALLNASSVGIRRAQIGAGQAADQAKAELREDLRLFREESGQGIDRSERIPDLRARAEALGLPDIVAEMDGAAADSVFVKVYAGALPVALEQRMAVLQGKDKRSDSESRELKWIEDHLPGFASRYDKDPVGYFAAAGGALAPPPLDFADAGSVAARSRWALAASKTTGKPVPMLSMTEAAQLADIYDGGRPGEESVMAMLERLPPAQAMQAARQIDPNDRTLPIVATLPANYRSMARRGREALKANPKLLSDPMRDDIDLNEGVAALNRQFDRALVGVPPDQRDAIFATAKQIAAGQVDKHGSVIDERLWSLALNMAMGAVGTGAEQKGGFGLWADRWFVLPAGVSAQGFRRAVQAELAAGENPPVNSDKTRANIARAFPVAVGPGLYEFRDMSGHPLRTAGDDVWRVRVTAK